jgi:hypothetical protein
MAKPEDRLIVAALIVGVILGGVALSLLGWAGL